MRPQILLLQVDPLQMFLIVTASMAVVFINNMNTAITFVYEYASLSADVLIMTAFIVSCLQLQNFVLFVIVAKTVPFMKAAAESALLLVRFCLLM